MTDESPYAKPTTKILQKSPMKILEGDITAEVLRMKYSGIAMAVGVVILICAMLIPSAEVRHSPYMVAASGVTMFLTMVVAPFVFIVSAARFAIDADRSPFLWVVLIIVFVPVSIPVAYAVAHFEWKSRFGG